MTYIYARSRHQRSGTTMQKSKLRGALKSFHGARTCRAGFPWAGKFSTTEEAEQYVGGERIVCLLCGHEFKKLNYLHLRVHDIDAEDYRARFGIPRAIGLSSAPAREAQSRMFLDGGRAKELQSRIVSMGDRAKPRAPLLPRQVERRLEVAAAALATIPPNEPKYRDFSWHLATGRAVYDCLNIAPPPGVASWSGFKKRRRGDAALNAAWKAARAERIKGAVANRPTNRLR